VSDSNLSKAEGFQRRILLEIVNRNERDRIRSVDLYRWIQKQGVEVYPIKFTIAERKLRYFAMINREENTALARRMFWSDIVNSITKDRDFEYEHVRDVKKALSIMGISVARMNRMHKDKEAWESKVKEMKQEAFEKWCTEEDTRYNKDKVKRYAAGRTREEAQKEVARYPGWEHKPRPLK
jgi:hypothetical protein